MKIKELIEMAGGMGAGSIGAVSMPFMQMHRRRKDRLIRHKAGEAIQQRRAAREITEEELEEQALERALRVFDYTEYKG
jgi:hypothetical protein